MKLSTIVLAISLSTAGVFWDCSKKQSESPSLKSTVDFSDANAIRNSGAVGIYEDGWMGPEASIALDNSAHASTLFIEGTNVQTKPGDEALVIVPLANKDTLRVVNIPVLGSFNEGVLLPQKVRQCDTLNLRLISSKSFVPSKLGTSKDDRVLSLRLGKISLIADRQLKDSFPTSFEFPAAEETNSNVHGIYSDGWMSDSASVTLFNPQNKKMVEIRGSVPLNVFKGIATLEVHIGGQLQVKQQLQNYAAGNFRVRFQLAEDNSTKPKLVVTLKPSGSFVPGDLGINADRRRISFRLEYFGLQ